MKDLFETLSEATFALRATALPQALLRFLVAVAGSAAGLLCFLWFPHPYGPVLLGAAIALALASAVLPDSAAPTVTLAGLALWWFVGAAAASWWQWAVMALLLAVFHFGAGLAAASPPWARADAGVVRRWARSAAAYLGLSAGAVAVAIGAALTAGLPRGMGWVVAGAALLLAAGIASLRRMVRAPQGSH